MTLTEKALAKVEANIASNWKRGTELEQAWQAKGRSSRTQEWFNLEESREVRGYLLAQRERVAKRLAKLAGLTDWTVFINC